MKRRAKLIRNARSINVRKCPWDPLLDQQVSKTFKAGDPIMIDDELIVYDWQGHEFYAAFDEGGPIGYIRKEAIEE